MKDQGREGQTKVDDVEDMIRGELDLCTQIGAGATNQSSRITTKEHPGMTNIS